MPSENHFTLMKGCFSWMGTKVECLFGVPGGCNVKRLGPSQSQLFSICPRDATASSGSDPEKRSVQRKAKPESAHWFPWNRFVVEDLEAPEFWDPSSGKPEHFGVQTPPRGIDFNDLRWAVASDSELVTIGQYFPTENWHLSTCELFQDVNNCEHLPIPLAHGENRSQRAMSGFLCPVSNREAPERAPERAESPAPSPSNPATFFPSVAEKACPVATQATQATCARARVPRRMRCDSLDGTVDVLVALMFPAVTTETALGTWSYLEAIRWHCCISISLLDPSRKVQTHVGTATGWFPGLGHKGNLWSSNMSESAIQDQKDSSNPVVSFVDVSLLKPHHVQIEWRFHLEKQISSWWFSVMLTVTRCEQVFPDGSARGPSWKSKNRSLIVCKITFCACDWRPVCKLKAVLAVIRYRHYIQSLWINKWINKFID